MQHTVGVQWMSNKKAERSIHTSRPHVLNPTNRLIPTVFGVSAGFLPLLALAFASKGCSFSHRSSSLYASIAVSRSHSACCRYSKATSYLRRGDILWSAHNQPSACKVISTGSLGLTPRLCKLPSISSLFRASSPLPRLLVLGGRAKRRLCRTPRVLSPFAGLESDDRRRHCSLVVER